MTCYKINYVLWRSQCCKYYFLPQGYQRSQNWEWIIWQNIHLFKHFLFPTRRRFVKRAKIRTPIWNFTIFLDDDKLCVRDFYLERRNIWRFGESQFLVSHINCCLRQQSLGISSCNGRYTYRSVWSTLNSVSINIIVIDWSNWGLFNRNNLTRPLVPGLNISKILQKKYPGIWF